jgi:membrane protein
MGSPFAFVARGRALVAELLHLLHDWPYRATLATLRKRFGEDHLSLTASSLTFTTLLALVPLLAVVFTVFAAAPMLADLRLAFETRVLPALLPGEIARPVLSAVTRFAERALTLGGLGLASFLVSSLLLLLTIDRALNAIWRVRRPRPFGQRMLVYWGALTLGPLVLAVSLTASSYALSVSRGWVGPLSAGAASLLGSVDFVLLAALMAGLFHYVPNTYVRWAHAWAGGIFVAIGFEMAKKAMAWYVTAFPGNAAVYGAAAALPVLLLWIYSVWLVVLFGAVIAAYAPSLSMRVALRVPTPGHRFDLALDVLRELERARTAAPRGRSLQDFAAAMRLDPLQLEPVLETLVALDWVGRLDEGGAQRHVLLCEPATTSAAPLLEALLLSPSASSAAFRERAGFKALTLADLLR